MKIRFIRNIIVDVETRDGEIYDKAYFRWQEIRVDDVFPSDKFVTIKLEDEMFLHNVPADSFEKVEEVKKNYLDLKDIDFPLWKCIMALW